MPISIPKDPREFLEDFVAEEFARVTAGRSLTEVPYSLSVDLVGGPKYCYRIVGNELKITPDQDGDARIRMSLEDFTELVRAARSNAPDERPPVPRAPSGYKFPELESLAGYFRVVVDDLGDKRTIDVYIKAPDGGSPKTVVHTTVDFIANQSDKVPAVEQLLRSGGVKIEGDLGYLLRLANALMGKTRRRER